MYFGSSPSSFWHLQVQTAFSSHVLFFILIFHGGFFWRRLLLIGIAVVAIILGHEMACLASDAVSLLCILINCVLKRRLWFKARAQGVEHNMISRRGLKRYRPAHMQQSACTQFPLLSLPNIRHFTYSFQFPTSAHAAVG